MEEKFKITFAGMDPTEALKDYAMDKFTKHQHLVDLAVSIDIIMTQNIGRRGVDKDFELSVTASVPRTRIHVEDRGEDMYALIDKLSDIFYRLLKRYQDRLAEWEGKKKWEVVEIPEDDGVENVTNYADYVPKIVEKRKMQDLSPMDVAEAIENMELQGWDQFMFKDGKSGKLSVVYRVGNYFGLIEEPDSI